MPLPDIVIHCDWSTDISKRVFARAERINGHYLLTDIDLVGRFPQSMLDFRIREPANRIKTRFVGFDVPFGVPLPYAQQLENISFLNLLDRFGKDEWEAFYQPASEPGEISLYRPFYPARPGGKKRQQLIDGLGLTSSDDLMRQCDRATSKRAAGSPLFWTLGAKQVGKAAISVWEKVLGPLQQAGELDIALWPFEGSLDTLLAKHQITLAEVYPAEMYHHLELDFRPKESKRRHSDRLAKVNPIVSFAQSINLRFAPHIQKDIQSGFGTSPIGEDAFDACVGLIGMLGVLAGKIPAGEPDDELVRRVEGSILGYVP